MIEKEPVAIVSGMLAIVLKVSRLACVAPLHFTKQRGGWRVSLSRRFHVYGCIIMTILNAIILTATLLDFQKEPQQSIRMQSSTRCVVWLMDVAIMTGIVFYGAFAAPRHLRTMIYCLNYTQQINLELNVSHGSKRGENKMLFFLGVWTVLTVMVTVNDHVIQLIIIKKQQNLDLVCFLYIFYYFSYWIMQLLIFQFLLIVLRIRESFKNINEKLGSLEQGMSDLTKISARPPVVLKATALNKMRKKSVNSIIDSLAFVGKVKPVEVGPTHEKVRRLALAYVALCHVVREMDRQYGVMLVLLLASFLLHMTITPYYLINHVFNNNENRGAFYVLSQCVWCVYHTGCLVMMIEPCHLTLTAVSETRCHISLLMRQLNSPSEPLTLALDLFYKHITLNEVSFSPLHITTLTRGLVATIVSTIITYLVVIIQL